MSLIAKLWSSKPQAAKPPAEDKCADRPLDRNPLHFGADRVRILLFRECEYRGRSLLFDSFALERSKRCSASENNNNNKPSSCRNVGRSPKSRRDNATLEPADTATCEHGKFLSDDISILSEMIFGTVAMTYRGPSFKIHTMTSTESPECLMCTKVFPYSEHIVCRKSERHSNDTLGASTNFDSNSSNSSLRTQPSRPGSGNLSGNSLSPTLRKNSTCSSTGSGWDIDVPRLGSSHSLDGSSSSSLSSLRRRWQRVVSTSLNRSESDDVFGYNGDASAATNGDTNARKHKTRLGLAMILHLPGGRELKMINRLLEHAALLEGMLDRLRHSCRPVDGMGPEVSLVNRLYHASDSCTLRLLRLLLTQEPESPTPLLWHDLLLNSSLSVDVQVNTVYRSLQQMCRLLEEFDTKNTNFFISTIVTAVLTHHLGWVYTAPSQRNRQMMEALGQQYLCNPLWAQLNDLYGALGTPARMAHTVIAGEPEKANLIESVLNFLSYFLRSGLVEKRQESRCALRMDVQEAIAILERALRKNPALEQQQSSPPTASTFNKRPVKCSTRRSKQLELTTETPYAITKSKSCEEPRKGLKKLDVCIGNSSVGKANEVQERKVYEHKEETSVKKLKRSSTLQSKLNEYASVVPNSEPEERKEEERQASSKVKIIVSDENERKIYKDSNALLRNLDKLHGSNDVVDATADSTLAAFRRHKLAGLENFDASYKAFDDQSLVFPSTLADDMAHEVKAQVYFTLGGEEKPNLSIRERLKSTCKCQCSYTFTRVPSTSAELPEGVLRKILQRNFPESSKNMQPPAGSENDFGICLKCKRGFASSSNGFDNGKLMLETPTNATEVLRGCASSSSAESSRVGRSNSLEALIEASCVIELPMPRSKKVPPLLRKKSSERVGFSKSLISSKVNSTSNLTDTDSGYTWGMVVQGFTKSKKKGRRRDNGKSIKDVPTDSEKAKTNEKDQWWWPIREGLNVEAKFPLIDQPISEALCILGDLDNWQVGLVSNTSGSAPMPVGMSRLVSNMLEAFSFMWKEFRSPEQCIKLLESRLREMWLRSETLAEFLLAADLGDASVDNLTNFLDVDAADLPLLLAVATTHTPQIAQRFGLTLA